MKRSIPTIVSLVIIIAIGIAVFWNMRKAPPEGGAPIVATSTPSGSTPTIPAVTVVVDNLEIPWDIAFLPSAAGASAKEVGDMLVTERPGSLIRIARDGSRKEIPIVGVKRGG